VRTYQITVNGKQYNVEIEDLDASPVVVQINGQSFEVIVSDTGPARAPVRVTKSDEPEFEMDAYVPAVTATYQEIDVDESDSQASAPAAAAQPVAEGAVTVSAPMPGTILDIAVKVGDQVSQGDTLCNLEAMKMKSPIRSPGKGTIAHVLISERQNVAYGDVLFTLT
jgi:biotin carboxyl carrier protein